jgi:hypothetical protein
MQLINSVADFHVAAPAQKPKPFAVAMLKFVLRVGLLKTAIGHDALIARQQRARTGRKRGQNVLSQIIQQAAARRRKSAHGRAV